MRIVIRFDGTLPPTTYGGTERVVWSLAWGLTQLGHAATLITDEKVHCRFADTLIYQPGVALKSQIPEDTDVVHFHNRVEPVRQPYIYTQHGNGEAAGAYTVFVSKQQAMNHGGSCYVHNGLNWNRYGTPDLNTRKDYFHFLGKAAWRVKNVRGAIRITRRSGQKLIVMGGTRLNFNMGFRFTPDRHVRFYGMVDDRQKSELLIGSRGLIFPVTWHEPFGLSLIESLYFGCPVFGTGHGSLPEIITGDVGFISNREFKLIDAVNNADQFSRRRCYEYARDVFNAEKMASDYLIMYERVTNGERLNKSIKKVKTQFRDLEYLV